MLAIAAHRRGYLWIGIVVAASVFYAIVNKKRNIDEYGYIISSQITASLFGIGILTIKGWWFVPSGSQAAWLLLAAITYNFFNQYFYLKALKLLNVGRLATLSYFSPVITCLLGFLMLGEKISVIVAAGLMLIIAANLWTLRLKTGKSAVKPN